MNALHIRSIAALCLASGLALAGPVAAQTAAGPNSKAAMPCANAPASAPCTGAGMGMGMGMGHGGMAGADYTHGWSMMTPQERSEHQAQMQGMKSAEACRAYRVQHHQQMTERAKARGGKPLPTPRHDGCAGMKP